MEHGENGRSASTWILDSERNRRVVDGVRAIGIVLVIAFHAAFLLAKALPRERLDEFVAGLPGVLNVVWQALGSEVVFFSSGFLLSYLLIRELRRRGSIDVRDFAVKRISRIVPLFLIALVVFTIGRNFYWDRFAANLFFVARVTGHKNYIPVGWSLEVMMQVYLALPVLVWCVLASKRPFAVCCLLVVASVVPRWFALAGDPSSYTTGYYELVGGVDAPAVQRDLYYVTWYRLTPFLIGLAAAVLATEHRARLARWFQAPGRAVPTFVLGAALFVASGFLPIHDQRGWVYTSFTPEAWHLFWTIQRPVLATGIAVMLLGALFVERGLPGYAAKFLSLRVFTPISERIYSIYLFHFACLIPAALLVFAPTVFGTLAAADDLDRKELQLEMSRSIGAVTVWHYLAIVLIATWLSTKLAGVLTRRIEAPTQEWLRRRFGRARSVLVPLPKRHSEAAGSTSREPEHAHQPALFAGRADE